jgi:hypothetical protein
VAAADGDPASDVLLSQPVFVPWDAGASPLAASRLRSVVEAAARAGYPVRVAVVASAADLGSVSQLWRRPQAYAEFLGAELSLATGGAVVVVMPDGTGVFRSGLRSDQVRTALAKARGTARGESLLAAGETAVAALAGEDGHSVSVAHGVGAGNAARTPPAIGTVGWVVLLLGAVLVVAAWSVSLRARPLRRPDRLAPG